MAKKRVDEVSPADQVSPLAVFAVLPGACNAPTLLCSSSPQGEKLELCGGSLVGSVLS